jgi:hypothetical protein
VNARRSYFPPEDLFEGRPIIESAEDLLVGVLEGDFDLEDDLEEIRDRDLFDLEVEIVEVVASTSVEGFLLPKDTA